MKAYPKYKDSGVAWLEHVPEQWKMFSLGALMVERKELNKNRNIDFVLSVTKDRGVIPYAEKGNIGNKASEDTTRYKIVREDDIVLNSMNVIIGSVGISNYVGCLSPVYYVLTSRDANLYDPKYLNFYFQTKPFQRSLVRIGNGILAHRMRIPMEKLKREPFPLPSFPEQQQISRYLDWQTSKINKFIKAKKKLIALLKEQKQNIINEAVTKGINPDVAMKDSGVEWLGEIPAHWEVKRVKQCASKVSKGTTPSTEGRSILESGEVRFLKAENLVAGNITDTPLCFIDEETNNILKRSQLQKNDVLFVIAGATLGKIAIVNEVILPANTNQAIAFIRPNHSAESEYLALWLSSQSITSLIWLEAVQSAQPNLSMDSLGNFIIPTPPIAEQNEIVAFVHEETALIDKTISCAEREIELIAEYRTRLVSDVVTGKVDIRSVEIPEFEPVEADLEAQDDEESEDELIAEGIEK